MRCAEMKCRHRCKDRCRDIQRHVWRQIKRDSVSGRPKSMAYIVMAYIVMAYIGTADSETSTDTPETWATPRRRRPPR